MIFLIKVVLLKHISIEGGFNDINQLFNTNARINAYSLYNFRSKCISKTKTLNI